MLGLGWAEMLVIAVVALIFVGPKDLPVLMRQIGRTLGTVRRMGNDFRREFNKMAAMDEIVDVRKSLTEPLRNAQAEIQREFNRASSSGVQPSGAIKPLPTETDSVVGALKSQAGMTEFASDAAKASMAAAMAKAKAGLAAAPETAIATGSIAGNAAAPPRRPARKSPAKTGAGVVSVADATKAEPKPGRAAKAKAATAGAAAAAKAPARIQPLPAAKSAVEPKPATPRAAPKSVTPKPAAKTAAKPRASGKPAAKAVMAAADAPVSATPARRRAASKPVKS